MAQANNVQREAKTEVKIEDVSDTALWVAYYRGKESERPDALFKDRLASRLVGDRGAAIAKHMNLPGIMEWVMVVRTVAIDRLILTAIKEGVDTILNLGAGLDTRPYRLPLPKDLRWIEIDFPHLIEMKNAKLEGEVPNCHLERISLDLTKRPLRRETLAQINAASKRVLVITEGVIPYLSNTDAAELADDLFDQPKFEFWIQDFFSSGWPRPTAIWRKRLQAAPFKFNVPDWFIFFKDHGWVEADRIRALDEAKRIGRPSPKMSFAMKLKWMVYFIVKPSLRKTFRDSSGYVRMKRAK